MGDNHLCDQYEQATSMQCKMSVNAGWLQGLLFLLFKAIRFDETLLRHGTCKHVTD